jgi:pyruvate dehydrogenase E2 component (dihydrolipoyllysine-residue acetyltransferase)
VQIEKVDMLEICMPALPKRVKIEKIKLVEWHKNTGDEVLEGDLLAVVETNKAAIDIDAEYDGTLTKILVAAGTEAIEAGTPLAIMEVADGVVVKTPVAAIADEPVLEVSAPTPADSLKGASPLGGPTLAENREHAGQNRFDVATPLVLRIAKQRGIDLSTIKGSGANGRIVERDLEVLSTKDSSEVTERPAAAQDHIPHDTALLSGTASAVHSQSWVPQTYASAEVSVDQLLSVRDHLNTMVRTEARTAEIVPITLDTLIVKAMAITLKLFPEANVSWMETGILKNRNADIGARVSTCGGVITPVIREADTKGLMLISSEMDALVKQAASDSLTVVDCTGNSTTIYNMGHTNVRGFTETVSPPLGSILTVGGVEERPVFQANSIVNVKQITITFCADQRCIDGMLAVNIVNSVKRFLEQPALMLM